MKKLLSLILCVTLLLGVFPFVLPVTAVDGSSTTDTVIGKVLDNAAYVSSTGNDSTATVNDKAKPFATVHAAMNALIEVNGGYVVVVDNVSFPRFIGYSVGNFNAHECVIVITSKYGGVDYRTSGAVLEAGPAADGTEKGKTYIVAHGPTIFENINIQLPTVISEKSAIYFCANLNPFVMGEGIKFFNASGAEINDNNLPNEKDQTISLLGNGIDSAVVAQGVDSVMYVYSGYYSFIIGATVSKTSNPILAKFTLYFCGGYANRVFGGTYGTNPTNPTKPITGAGGNILYMKGGKINDLLMGCQQANASDSQMNSNCYLVLEGTAIQRGISDVSTAVHATSTGLYDVLIYDSTKYPALTSTAVFEHVIDKANGVYADEVYVKQGGAGKKDGSSEANAAPDLTTAYLLLGEDGGTIKLCSDYSLTPITNGEMFECTGNGQSTAGRYFIEPYHTGKVIITSASEKVKLSTGGRLIWALSGNTTFDKVGIDTTASLYIVCRFNDLEITENCSLAFAENERPWIVAGSSISAGISGFQPNYYIGGRFKGWNEDVTVKVTSPEAAPLSFAAIYGFTGYNVAGQKYTGKYTLDLENTIASTVVLGVRGATGTGSAGSAVLNMRGTTSINALYPAGDNPNGPTTGDVTVNYYGGTVVNNAFGDANLVLGTTTFNDLSANGNADLCDKAFRDGFDVVTGYKTVTLANPASLDLANVTDVMFDGLTVKSRGTAKALRALHESGDNFTILVPEDTTASTIQMVTETDNYAYTVCPVQGVMTANRAEDFDNAFTSVGFSIRSEATADRLQGLRYKTDITAAAADAASEFGLLAKKTAKTADLVITAVDASDAAKGDVAISVAASATAQHLVAVTDDAVTFASAVTGIPENADAYKTSISFRAYVTAEIDGNSYTFYGNEYANTIYEVAKLVTGDNIPEFVQSVITIGGTAQQ